MQTLEQLISPENSAWPILSQWIESARNHCYVIKKDQSSAEHELFTMQMPTSSPMGAVIYETGGILIHHGWLRILGSGSFKLPRGLMDWNFSKSFNESGEKPKYLLVADDVKQLDGNQIFVFTPDLSQYRKIAINERQKHEVNIETHYQASFAEKNKFDLAYSVA